MSEASTVLVSVHGPDRPGITAALMGVLGDTGAEIHDVEQIVVRGRLTLNVLIEAPGERATISDLLLFGWENDLHLEFEVVDEAPTPARSMAIVTVLGAVVGAAEFGTVAAAIADSGGNIERIYRISRYPVVTYELAVSGGDLDEMRAGLMVAAERLPIDVAIQPDDLLRRAKRIIVMDVDSTLIENEVIDLLAAEAGVEDRVSALTASAMAGDIDFEDSLKQRVALLEGLEEGALGRVAEKITLTKGARTFIRTVKRLGMATAVVSAGFTQFTDALVGDLSIEYSLANTLELADGRLTGRLTNEVVDGPAKAGFLRAVAEAEGVPLSQVVAVGDGANDLEMLAAAGLGIAFNARPVVNDTADTALTVPFLDAILFLMGVRREHVDAADAADPAFDQAPLIDVPGVPPV